MKRRLLSVIVSLLLVVGMVYPALTVVNAAVWDGSTAIPTLSGDVYQIATAENLAWFANAVNSGTTAINAVLTADIELNETGAKDNQWTPIGTVDNPFEGVFDGAGYTISGLYINSTEDYIGLFGVINDTANSETVSVTPEYIVQSKTIRVKNLKVTDADVTGDQNVGGIVGYSIGGGIKDCYFSGSVTGTYNSVGGILGWGSSKTVVAQCQSTGSVTGKQRTGGIVGYCSSNTVVSKCYSDISVTGTKNVGGIVGTLSGSNLVGCFFLGSVTANDIAGGIVGYSTFSLMRGAYAIPTITSEGTQLGGALGKIFGGEYTSLFYCYETALCDGPVGIARTVEEMQISDFVKELNKTMVYFCFDYTNINNGYPVLVWMLETDVWTGEMEIPSQNASGVYLIYEPAELAWFAGLVNGTVPGIDANPAASAEVKADLLFNINVYDESFGITEWTPIGNTDHPFTGSFKGGGFNIAGIYTTATAGDSGKNVGLFGYVGSGATIDNLLVMDGLIIGVENVGGIAGYATGAQITNAVCDSEVRGDKAVGGVVGNIAASTTLSACGMIGSINGTNETGDKSYLQNVGGVVGYNNRSTVNKSFSYSDITAADARYVGGVIGNNVGGTVNNCYSTSTIVGSSNCGGIVGYNNNGTVAKCYTAGKVTASSLAGIAFGQTSGSNVSECYYDSSYVTISNTIAGATAKSTEEMSGTRAISGLGLSTGEWRFLNDDTYFYYYPQINSMAYSASRTIRMTSLESVRRVQPQYVARVEIDGRIDTYYETLADALTYASTTESTVLPTVYLVRDAELAETLEISATIGIYGENGAALKRATDFTGTMINVTGNLTLGSSVYGDDTSPDFYFDGNLVEGTESGVTVQKDATLNVESGIEFGNFKTVSASTATVRGAVIKSVGGTVNVKGGIFNGNISKTVGGAIYSEEGTVNITGGTFKNNEATQGAAVYNNNGDLTVTGGTFTGNIASLNGGACATYGLYGKTVISDNATFDANQATNGGALSTSNYGAVEINGGTFTANVAYASGGALFVASGSSAVMTSGYIAENVSNQSQGGAVYNAGTFTMKGEAQIDSTNDVYLVKNVYITIAEQLGCSGYAATITPEAYGEGQQVLDGTALGTSYSKFGLSNSNWYILANGKMTSLESTTVAIVSKVNAYSVQFISLYDAFESVAEGEEAIITVVADNTITKPITVKGDVTLTCDDTSYVSMRGGAFHGILFDVQSGAKLRLGDTVENVNQQAQADYAAGTVTEGQMIIDGGYGHTGVVGAAAVNVQSGGELHLYDDAIIQNFKNTTTSVITVSGTMYMYGGTICNNISTYGGAVYVKSAGNASLSGGVIYGNTSENGGNAIYSEGKVTRNIRSYDYYYIETVYQTDENGDFVLDDNGNKVVDYIKDPVYYSTVSTDVFIKQGDEVYLANNLMYLGESTTDVYLTNTSNVPTENTMSMSTMTLDFAEYTLGSVVLSGSTVATHYTAFETARFGYFIQSDGTLGLNKLVPKADSGLAIDRENDFISGFDLEDMTVGNYISSFENDSSYLRFYDMNGKVLRNTYELTTCCYIQLRDSNGTVIDTVTVVVYGDVNCDYSIDGQDSVLISAMADGMLTADNTEGAMLEAADVNFDGEITSIDAEHTDMSGLFLQTIGQSKA
ncbi:MAG: hypothetical protein IJ447_00200 [Clostridia bacterium]|nr:hypothetical protein [Clostridia bacterium]